MLLNETGLVIERLDQTLAQALGNVPGETGSKVLAETIAHRHAQVRLLDWFYCLLKTETSQVYRVFIGELGREAHELIEVLEECSIEEPASVFVTSLNEDSVEAQALDMLQRSEAIAEELLWPKVTDAIMSIAILECVDENTSEMLAAWLDVESIKPVVERLRAKLKHRELPTFFDSQGRVQQELLHVSARNLLDRMAEDAKSLRAQRLTTRHLLYSLIGRDGAPLRLALEVRAAMDTKKGIHSSLSRELKRPGKKRLETFELTRQAVFDTVAAVLDHSVEVSLERGELLVTERDVAVSFLDLAYEELKRVAGPEQALEVSSLKNYLLKLEAEEEEEAPLHRVSIDEITRQLKERISGQHVAIDRVIPWIKRLRFGMPRDGRPAAVFLFLGPTGAGKTQLAKELAKHVYGSEEKLIFVEMGQFQTKESMSGLIGAPPGYIGYGEGILTNGLADKPECVVLFDEIEKGHVQVFDVLLRFADEGVISDPAGPVRDGSRCIIVMTTNAGQRWLRAHLARTPKALDEPEALVETLFEEAMKELQEVGFRPEFLGRVDERISFLPFTRAVCRQIVEGVLEKEVEKFKKLKDITLEVPEDVRDFLAGQAFSRSSDEGARGAPRAVNQYIVTPAIDVLTSGDDPAGCKLKALCYRGDVKLEVSR